MNKIPLTEDQFSLLGQLDGWAIDDVPKERWSLIPGVDRKADIFAVMASGCLKDPKTLNGINAVVGFDVLALERNPKPTEPDGNAYHYVVQRTNRTDHPYLLLGPFRSQTLVRHWFECDDLTTYWKESACAY